MTFYGYHGYSERIGWIPEPGELPNNLVDEYRWVYGLSVTEMEIVHGAYRKDNPNCKPLITLDLIIFSRQYHHGYNVSYR